MNKKLLLPLITLLAISSCGNVSTSDINTSETTSSYNWHSYEKGENKSTYYQLLVYSFADGNNDGIGDFKGIIDHLDYLEDLGIGGIWLSPINKAVSYHGYDVIDYEAINSDYEVTVNGITYSFDKLIEECHKRDIKVIMDMVLNHTSRFHKWYTSHPEWYTGSQAFSGDMCDLDYDNSALRNEVKRICRSYLEQGVDGFRLDAALWIYNEGSAGLGSHDDDKNIAWWKEFSSSMKSVNEDVYIIGEVLDSNTNYAKMYNAGDIETFDFERTSSLYDAVINKHAFDYATYASTYKKEITSYRDGALGGGVISNHDIGRFTCPHEANSYGQYYVTTEDDIKYALALHILSPGNSYLYYGDELGLQGTCPTGWTDMSFRTPMPFTSGRTNSQIYFNNFKGTGATSSSTFDNSTIEEMQNSSSSIYNLVKKAIAFKNSHPTFTSNPCIEQIYTQDQEVGGFVVYNGQGGGDYSVFFNSGDDEAILSCSYPDPDCYPFYVMESFGKGKAYVANTNLYLPSKTVAVLAASPDEVISTNGKTEALTPTLKPIQTSPVTKEVDGLITIYYDNKDTKWSKVNIYTWVNNIEYTSSWPGEAMTKYQDDWYTFTLDHGAANIIFNNSSSQTDNLALNSPGTYWYSSSNWYYVCPR